MTTTYATQANSRLDSSDRAMIEQGTLWDGQGSVDDPLYFSDSEEEDTRTRVSSFMKGDFVEGFAAELRPVEGQETPDWWYSDTEDMIVHDFAGFMDTCDIEDSSSVEEVDRRWTEIRVMSECDCSLNIVF